MTQNVDPAAIALQFTEVDRHLCTACGKLIDPEDAERAGPLYECGNCGTQFNRDNSANNNHQCPDCNKFASKSALISCSECGGELGEELSAAWECDICGETMDPDEAEEHREECQPEEEEETDEQPK